MTPARWFLPLFFALLFLPFALLANSVPFLKDAGELTAAMVQAGIAHPTGFPGQHLFSQLLLALPVGSASLRLSLVSVIGGVGAATALAALLLHLVPRAERGRGAWRVWSTAAVAGFGLLWADVCLFHGLNVEVYMPSLGLSGLLVYLGLRSVTATDDRWWRLLALAGGLAVGFHITCVAVFGLVAVVAAGAQVAGAEPGARLRRAGMLLAGAVPFAFLGALVLLYLPIRAATDPVRNWGDPDTLGRLLAHVSGRSIRSSFAGTMLQTGAGHLVAHGERYVWQMVSQVGSLLPLAALGAVSLWRVRLSALLMLALVLLFDGLFSVLVNPMGQLEKQTGTLSLFSLVALAAFGTVWLLAAAGRWQGRRARAGGGAALAVLCATLLLLSPSLSLTPEARAARGGDHGYRWALEGFRHLPPESLLVTGQDDLSALSLYLKEVEVRRPDVVHLIRQMICAPSMRDSALVGHEEHPARAAVLLGIKECGSGEADEVNRSWARVAAELQRAGVGGGWELGLGVLDRMLGPVLRPRGPCFELDWSLDPATQRREGLALLDGMDEFDREWSGDFADDISAMVLSEWVRLVGTFFLQQARPGDLPLLSAACGALNRAARMAPQNCRAWNNLSVCLAGQGELMAAAAAAEKGASWCPLYVTVRVNLVRYLFLETRESEGRAALAALVEDGLVDEARPALERLRQQLADAGLRAAVEAIDRVL